MSSAGYRWTGVSNPVQGLPYGLHRRDREKEHHKDMDTIAQKFTSFRKTESETEYHPSALTNNIAQSNHMIDWEKVKFLVKEPAWMTKGIKEAIQTKKMISNALNRTGSTANFPTFTPGCFLTYHLLVGERTEDDSSSLWKYTCWYDLRNLPCDWKNYTLITCQSIWLGIFALGHLSILQCKVAQIAFPHQFKWPLICAQ